MLLLIIYSLLSSRILLVISHLKNISGNLPARLQAIKPERSQYKVFPSPSLPSVQKRRKDEPEDAALW